MTQTEDLFLEDTLAIAAADIIARWCEDGRYGRKAGFPASETTKRAMQSAYVKQACEMFSCIVHVERAGLLRGTRHPWFVWVEKEKGGHE